MRINVKKIVFIYCIIISIIATASFKIFFLGYQGGALDVLTVKGILFLSPIIIFSLIIIIIGLSRIISAVAKQTEDNDKDLFKEFTKGFDKGSLLFIESISRIYNEDGVIKIVEDINREFGEEVLTLKRNKNEQEEEE